MMPLWLGLWSLLLLGVPAPIGTSILKDMERPVPSIKRSAVVNGRAFLPCDILSTGGRDDIFLILWFKDNATKPMYSIDVVGKSLSSASQWGDSGSLGSRASFRSDSGETGLIIDRVAQQDEGTYRCRVDYRNSPTKNFKIQLSVIVPPDMPVIRDAAGRVVTQKELGPYQVGETMEASCEVTGGNPRPAVTWWKEGAMYDTTYTIKPDGTVVNLLSYPNLQREDLGVKFVCQASNSNSTLPLSRYIQVSVKLPPTKLSILEKPTYVSEGRGREVTCQAIGGHPPPRIEWWIGNRNYQPTFKNIEYQGVSTSRLHYVPVIEDDGKYLICRVILKDKTERVLEDSWEIKVLYKPVVNLRLGRSLDPDNLRTGNDVYFECDVKANPEPHKLVWRHNGVEIIPNADTGVIISSQSLVLQKVTKERSGSYSCLAVNSEGTGTSSPVKLNIMYAPICEETEFPKLIPAELNTPTVIECKVDAYPRAVEYKWFFNNTDLEEWIGPESYSQDGLVSSLQFVPKTSKDFGHLYCIGINSIGEQTKPCHYQILPTGKPSRLTDCAVLNKTLTAMKIECTEGFDGGLPANFLLEIYDADNMEIRFQATQKVPVFEVSGLQPATELKIYLYAENVKGLSEPVILEDQIPGKDEHIVQVTNSKAVKVSSALPGVNTTEQNDSHLTLIISIAAGGCVICLVILTLVIICSRKKLLRKPREPILDDTDYNCSQERPQQDLHANPDLISAHTYYSDSSYHTDLGTRLLTSRELGVTGSVPSMTDACSAGSGNRQQHSMSPEPIAILAGPEGGHHHHHHHLHHPHSGRWDGSRSASGGGADQHPLSAGSSRRSATLDRRRLQQVAASSDGDESSAGSYFLSDGGGAGGSSGSISPSVYHTCSRAPANGAGKRTKRVTIVEGGNVSGGGAKEESEV